MTFLEPAGEPRPRKDQRQPGLSPWAQRRLTLAGLPVVSVAATAGAIWLRTNRDLGSWQVVAGCVTLALLCISWSLVRVSRRELVAIDLWSAVGASMPDPESYKWARRIDSFAVGVRGVELAVSPIPPTLGQGEWDRIGERVATSKMLRLESLEVIKNPSRLRGGYSAQFRFVQP